MKAIVFSQYFYVNCKSVRVELKTESSIQEDESREEVTESPADDDTENQTQAV